MGLYVHLHVSFACDRNEGVAAVAAKHRATIATESDAERAAGWFLDDLSKRTGNNPGSKGGLSLWGMVGNYTRVGDFCEALRPFWEELLSDIDGGPCSFEHILVFGEQEQTEAATAYEIFWDNDDSPDRKLVIKAHEGLPFTWMQM